MFRPDTVGDLCSPDTTPEKDSIKGSWVRVERNLNYENGYLSGYLVSLNFYAVHFITNGEI
jgi:hypothetical protein